MVDLVVEATILSLLLVGILRPSTNLKFVFHSIVI